MGSGWCGEARHESRDNPARHGPFEPKGAGSGDGTARHGCTARMEIVQNFEKKI